MRRQKNGQSLVEMAFVMPMLVIIVFGIVDISYYMFSYATIYQSVRNGAQTASALPPFPEWLKSTTAANWRQDSCTNSILAAMEENALFFKGSIANYAKISYPNGDNTRNLYYRGPIEVSVEMQIEPLTPLWNFINFGNDGRMTVKVTARRSLENLGNQPPSEEGEPNSIACKVTPD